MGKLLETIEAFNRKERFFLFSHATGNDPRGLALSEKFRSDLGNALDLSVPPDARGYIDYHLDWLHAAILLEAGSNKNGNWPNWEPGTLEPPEKPDPSWVSSGNQEDIDLLVTYEREGVAWLLLVEAKAETGWTNRQVRSKAKRLERIFGDSPIDSAAKVQPRFCLISPRRPQRLVPEDGTKWPEWMVKPSEAARQREFAWLELKVPSGRKKVTGSDANGTASADRKYWTVTTLGKSGDVVE